VKTLKRAKNQKKVGAQSSAPFGLRYTEFARMLRVSNQGNCHGKEKR